MAGDGIDADIYESTIQALEPIDPKLSPSGFCVIDDFQWPMCRQAVKDYRTKHAISAPVIDIDGFSAYWRKSAAETRLPSEYDTSVKQAEKGRKSYVATRLGAAARVSEILSLHRGHTQDVAGRVAGLLSEARHFNDSIAELRGSPVRDLEVVEIGPGQQLVELAFFATENSVVGIDTDLLVNRLSPSAVTSMIRSNGFLRTIKTLGRRLSGIDRRVRTELLRQLGLGALPRMRLEQMDAAAMAFGNCSVDVIYSRAVFEHLPDPAAVIAEIRRVLRPGGAMFIRLHLYASDSGIHDTRIFAGAREAIPYWSHLRPGCQHLSRPNTYLNRIRLSEWQRLFSEGLPGSQTVALMDAAPEERAALAQLRAAGELHDYTDEELLSPTVDVTWRKPEITIFTGISEER